MSHDDATTSCPYLVAAEFRCLPTRIGSNAGEYLLNLTRSIRSVYIFDRRVAVMLRYGLSFVMIPGLLPFQASSQLQMPPRCTVVLEGLVAFVFAHRLHDRRGAKNRPPMVICVMHPPNEVRYYLSVYVPLRAGSSE